MIRQANPRKFDESFREAIRSARSMQRDSPRDSRLAPARNPHLQLRRRPRGSLSPPQTDVALLNPTDDRSEEPLSQAVVRQNHMAAFGISQVFGGATMVERTTCDRSAVISGGTVVMAAVVRIGPTSSTVRFKDLRCSGPGRTSPRANSAAAMAGCSCALTAPTDCY